MNKQEYIEEILNLPYDWQIEIITKVLARTLDPDPEIEQAWIDEANLRLKQVESGEAKMIPQEEFEQEMKKLRELYREGRKNQDPE